MTPQEIEKEANELIPAYIAGTHPKFYNREEAVTIFISGANLVMERVRVLEEALSFYADPRTWTSRSGKVGIQYELYEDQQPGENIGTYGKRARAALERK